MKNYNKTQIVNNFSKSVQYYSEKASLPKQTAERLARALEPWRYSVPDGLVVEIGSGTGFFTEHLVEMFPQKNLIISDLTPKMVDYCRKKFSNSDKLSFNTIDAENHNWEDNNYAMISGNFVAQWFKDPSVTLSKMAGSLKPGGLMLMSFPGSESFPQWKKYCLELGLPFTANELPDIEQIVVNLSMGPVKVDFYEDQTTEQYEDLYTFFSHLKKTGYSTSFAGKSLSLKQIRLLNDYWLKQNNGKINVHYHTAFLAVKRDL